MMSHESLQLRYTPATGAAPGGRGPPSPMAPSPRSPLYAAHGLRSPPQCGYGASAGGGGHFGASTDQGPGGGKGIKKSAVLQTLNQQVVLWAGFLAAGLLVYFTLSGRHFSFALTLGAMARAFGFALLNLKIFSSGRATGVSVKTLQLYAIVFVCRLVSILQHQGYLPYDKSGDWLYHWIEVAALAFTGSALWACAGPFKGTYQGALDRFGELGVPAGAGAVYLATPMLLLAAIFHPTINKQFVSDVAWTYAMYLESSALVPQLYMFQQQASGIVDLLTAHFVAALGFGRLLEFIFWLYSHKELAGTSGSTLPGYLAVSSQFAQLALMADFFYYYFLAVKNAAPLVLPTQGSAAGMV